MLFPRMKTSCLASQQKAKSLQSLGLGIIAIDVLALGTVVASPNGTLHGIDFVVLHTVVSVAGATSWIYWCFSLYMKEIRQFGFECRQGEREIRLMIRSNSVPFPCSLFLVTLAAMIGLRFAQNVPCESLCVIDSDVWVTRKKETGHSLLLNCLHSRGHRLFPIPIHN